MIPDPSGPHANVFYKLENQQRTGSFKLRGAWLKLCRLDVAARQVGVVSASAGNHGAGLALAAAELGVPARVVVPAGTPKNKRARIAGLGAEIIVHGRGYDQAAVRATELAAATGAILVSAYDDDDIIDGNGAGLARELLEQVPSVARVVAPVGGGGLVGGLAKVLSPRGIAVVGIQPEANCAMAESRRLGRALTVYRGRPTVAEGCEGAVAERTFRLVEEHGVELVLVPEAEIEAAVADTYRRLGQVVECSAAVAVAGLAHLEPAPGATVVIVSGGNIDDDVLDDLLRRHP